MEDNLVKAIYENPSKCLECENFKWCKYKVWIGNPDCPEERSDIVITNNSNFISKA
jgi:hypothetical protein